MGPDGHGVAATQAHRRLRDGDTRPRKEGCTKNGLQRADILRGSWPGNPLILGGRRKTAQSHLQVEVPVDPPAATPIAATALRAPPSAYGLCADLRKRHAGVAKHRLGRDQVAPIGKRMTNVICKVHGTGIGMTTVANAVRRPWQAPRS